MMYNAINSISNHKDVKIPTFKKAQHFKEIKVETKIALRNNVIL